MSRHITGFTFNDVHSSTFDVCMKSRDRNTLPALRKRAITVLGRNGEYDFGGNTYENRQVSVDCSFVAEDATEIRTKIRPIAAWLSQKGRLIFDDEPGVYYIARLYSEVGFTQDVGLGMFTLTFECEPFAESLEHRQINIASITAAQASYTAIVEGSAETGCVITIKNIGAVPVTGISITRKVEV